MVRWANSGWGMRCLPLLRLSVVIWAIAVPGSCAPSQSYIEYRNRLVEQNRLDHSYPDPTDIVRSELKKRHLDGKFLTFYYSGSSSLRSSVFNYVRALGGQLVDTGDSNFRIEIVSRQIRGRPNPGISFGLGVLLPGDPNDPPTLVSSRAEMHGRLPTGGSVLLFTGEAAVEYHYDSRRGLPSYDAAEQIAANRALRNMR